MRAALLLSIAFLSSAAWARPVRLLPGQALTLTFVGGKLGHAEVATATLTPYDEAAAERLRADGCKKACGSNYEVITSGRDGVPERAAVPINVVKFTFSYAANGDSVLAVLNGVPLLVNYKARMHRGGVTTQTDVCQVMPSRGGTEHWPYRIDALELDGFSVSQWNEIAPILCE